MKGWLTIFKKELTRFFKDKRMVISTLLLPGLMIYLVYSLMGSGMGGLFGDKEHTPTAYVVNSPADIEALFSAAGLDIKPTEEKTKDVLLQEVQEGKTDICVLFPEGFSDAIENPSDDPTKVPNIEIYYNSAEQNSSAAYAIANAVLSEYEFAGENKYDINTPASGGKFDLATEKDVTSMIFSMLMPMLMMIFIFTGAMSIAPESIAGEKERGTFATILVTPVSRAGVAIGKIFALSIISVLCGLSSFIGIILSLPKLTGGMEGVNAALYSVGDYFALFGVVVSTVLLVVAMISVVSAFAKTVKEATAYITPLMIVNVLLSITCMFGEGAPTSVWLYLIPLYNSVQAFNAVFSFTVVALNLAVAMIANLAYTALLVWLLTKMFRSERVMFNR